MSEKISLIYDPQTQNIQSPFVKFDTWKTDVKSYDFGCPV